METKKKKLLYDIAISLGLIFYICLTTLIFINHKKITMLKEKIGSTKNKAKVQSKIITYTKNNKTVYSKRKNGNINVDIENHQQKMQEQKPDSEAYFKLGVLYFAKVGKEQQAIKCFKKTLDLKPNHPKKAAIQLWIKLLQKKLSKGNKN